MLGVEPDNVRIVEVYEDGSHRAIHPSINDVIVLDDEPVVEGNTDEEAPEVSLGLF